jgi:hypothetical protein
MQPALNLRTLSLKEFISALTCDSLRRELLPSRLESDERTCLVELIREALLKLPKATKPVISSSFSSLEERLQYAWKDLAQNALLVMDTEAEPGEEFVRGIRLLLLRVNFPAWPLVVAAGNLDPWLLMDLANCCKSAIPANIQERISKHITDIRHIGNDQDAQTLASYGFRFPIPQLASLIARLNIFHPQVIDLFVQKFFEDAVLCSKYRELTATFELRIRLYSALLRQGPALLLEANPQVLEKLSSFETFSTSPRELVVTFDLAVELSRILDMRSLSLEGLKRLLFHELLVPVAFCKEGISDLLASKYWTLLSAALAVDQLQDHTESLKSRIMAVFTGLNFCKTKTAACRGVSVFLAKDDDMQFGKELISALIDIATNPNLTNKLRWNVAVSLSSLLQCPGSLALMALTDEFLYGKVLYSWYVELEGLGNFKLAASLTELIVRWALHLGHPNSFFDLERVWSASKACEHFIASNTVNLEREDDSEEALIKSAERLLVALKAITDTSGECPSD